MLKKQIAIWVTLLAVVMCIMPGTAVAASSDIEAPANEGGTNLTLADAVQDMGQSAEPEEKFKTIKACGSGFVYSA